MSGGHVPPPPEYATPSLRRAKRHVAMTDELSRAPETHSVPPEYMSEGALERARREYAADARQRKMAAQPHAQRDRRIAQERRRQSRVGTRYKIIAHGTC